MMATESKEKIKEEELEEEGIVEPIEIKKMKTGIKGFDSLMTGGIPRGSAVLIEGGPGSGKTIFCLQTGWNAIQRGEKVLFMSFEERPERLVSHMMSFGWDVRPYIKNGQLRIKRYDSLDIARSVEALLSEAKKELLIEVRPMLFPKDFKPDVVLVDSLTSIASAFSGERSRFRVYMEQLFRYLEGSQITSFLIRETPTPTHVGVVTEAPGGGAVSFLSDGIIAIYNAIHPSGKRDRAIEIVKMRGESFKSGLVKMEITGKGVIIDPEKHLEGE
jgi:KaiC/GvpD/RAD55 family RecA-like ATPase